MIVTGLKLLMSCLAVIAAAVFVVAAISLLLRELWLGFRAKRSRQTILLAGEYVVRQEWSIKDPPAWERFENSAKPGRRSRVAMQLRGLGE